MKIIPTTAITIPTIRSQNPHDFTIDGLSESILLVSFLDLFWCFVFNYRNETLILIPDKMSFLSQSESEESTDDTIVEDIYVEEKSDTILEWNLIQPIQWQWNKWKNLKILFIPYMISVSVQTTNFNFRHKIRF